MKTIRITLDVELPNDFDEREIDLVLADTISGLDGHVLDIKEYIEIDEYN